MYLHVAWHFLLLSRVIRILNTVPCLSFAENWTQRIVFHRPEILTNLFIIYLEIEKNYLR